jgi:hypothetical protein
MPFADECSKRGIWEAAKERLGLQEPQQLLSLGSGRRRHGQYLDFTGSDRRAGMADAMAWRVRRGKNVRDWYQNILGCAAK